MKNIVIAIVIIAVIISVGGVLASALYAEKTEIGYVLSPDLEDYVFKMQDGRLLWAWESSCHDRVMSVCSDGSKDFDHCFLIESTVTICPWNDVIPGPLMRELLWRR